MRSPCFSWPPPFVGVHERSWRQDLWHEAHVRSAVHARQTSMQNRTEPAQTQTATELEYLLIQEPFDPQRDTPQTVSVHVLKPTIPDSRRRAPNGVEYSPLND
jgi:hypothetical protein